MIAAVPSARKEISLDDGGDEAENDIVQSFKSMDWGGMHLAVSLAMVICSHSFEERSSVRNEFKGADGLQLISEIIVATVKLPLVCKVVWYLLIT